MANIISEDQIEQALLQRLQHLCGYDALNCFTATPDDLNNGSGRTAKRELILAGRLRAAAQRLNLHAPPAAHEQDVAALMQPRTAMSLVAANCEVDALIRGGVPVEYEATAGPDAGKKGTERQRVIDFDTPAPQAGRNEYLAVTQLWVRGEKGFRRPDMLLLRQRYDGPGHSPPAEGAVRRRDRGRQGVHDVDGGGGAEAELH